MPALPNFRLLLINKTSTPALFSGRIELFPNLKQLTLYKFKQKPQFKTIIESLVFTPVCLR